MALRTHKLLPYHTAEAQLVTPPDSEDSTFTVRPRQAKVLSQPLQKLSLEGEVMPVTPITQMKRKSFWKRTSVFYKELAYLVIAIDLAVVCGCFFLGHPVYQIVSWVVIVVVWSNFSSRTIRQHWLASVDKLLTTLSLPAITQSSKSVKQVSRKAYLQSLQDDTTAYLQAIRKLHSIKEGK
jgi:hypothetical protein